MKKISSLLLVVTFLFSGAAFAEAVNGKVVSVNADASTIEVAKTDVDTGAVDNVVVFVNQATVYSGVAEFAEIAAGDDVKIEAVNDEIGNLAASSVDVVKVVA